MHAYFAACSGASADEVAAFFTPDAVVYDTNIAPVRGAANIGALWTKIRDRWGGALWTIDSALADGDHAVCEWTMTGTHKRTAFAFHGSDHYRFDGDRIAEIRQYWVFPTDPAKGSDLIGYER
jgi:limonene-1,2-epoxide hydrolase